VPGAAEILVAASSATTGCGSARVWRRRFLDPAPPSRGDLGGDEEGFTDFRLRRTVSETTRRLGRTTSWETSEFWDFGVPTEIPVPTVRHTPAAVAVPQAIWALRKAKRAYERNH